jgi:hypothetical protein
MSEGVRTMNDPGSRVRRGLPRSAIVLAAALALAVLLPAGPAQGLSPLPDYVTYIEDGGVWGRLPFGQDRIPYLTPAQVPTGDGGLEPPVEIVAFRWTPDGTKMTLLAKSTGSGSYREFSYDRQAKTLTTVGPAAGARPMAYADGTPVDRSATEAESPFGEATALLMRNGDPSVMQVFISYPGKPPVIVSAPEVRDRDCSMLSFSPSGSYVAYAVARPKGGTDVWVSTPDGRYSSLIASEAASPAFVPPLRPGTTGPGGSGSGGPGCPALAWLSGLTGIGATFAAFGRGRFC